MAESHEDPVAGLRARFASSGDSVAFWSSGWRLTYAELLADIEAAKAELVDRGFKVGQVLALTDDLLGGALARLIAGLQLGGIVALVRGDRGSVEQAVRADMVWLASEGIERVDRGGSHPLLDRLRSFQRPGLIFLSGGTSGQPKVVLHDAHALLRPMMKSVVRSYRLITIMPLSHIGGFDAIGRLLYSAATLVVPARIEPAAVAVAAREAGADVLVSTPSFLSLMRAVLPNAAEVISQFGTVAVGAEGMPPALLRWLKRECPETRLRFRFGTTETGAVIVHGRGDDYFTIDPSADCRVVKDELWLRQPGTMLGYLDRPSDGLTDDGWFKTGDLVEQTPAGTLRLKGRRNSTINVGGHKVHPEEIERALDGVEGIKSVRVFGEPHAILGQVVSVEVVAGAGVVQPELRAKIRVCAAKLPRFARPVAVRFVKSQALSETGKRAERVSDQDPVPRFLPRHNR